MPLVIKGSSNSFVLVFSQSELFIYSFLTSFFFFFRKFYDYYQTTLTSPSVLKERLYDLLISKPSYQIKFQHLAQD